MCLVYITLDALLALYGDNSTIPIESSIYAYIGCIRANYESYTDRIVGDKISPYRGH